MTRRLVLTNNGNGKAQFKFLLGKQRLFMPNILEGEMVAGTVIPIMIKFNAPFVSTIKT